MFEGQLHSTQFQYDNATPREDPPEPNLDSEINDLMTGVDTDLVSYASFKRCADEELYDLVPDGFCVELILAASRSKDPALKSMAKAARRALENHANGLLYLAWAKQKQERS
ncbi:MAG: hypothetical protein COA41_11220 [Sphingopyxis sp.]|nr:MAG: hypothetical protein COA41_11220 [Sphingopyxis sp.]